MSRAPTREEREAAAKVWDGPEGAKRPMAVAYIEGTLGDDERGSLMRDEIAQAIADAFDRGRTTERTRAAAVHGDAIARHLEGDERGGVGSINPTRKGGER